jgi:hypothetical protein
MLNIKHRIEELEKSAAESDLLGLLSCSARRRAGFRHLSDRLKRTARNLREDLPPDGSTTPCAQALRQRPLGLPSAIAAPALAA